MGEERKSAIEIRKAQSGRKLAYVGSSEVRVSEVAEQYVRALDDVIAERLQKSLPTLTKEQILAAIDYWREHRDEIDTVIREDDEGLAAPPSAFDDIALSAFAEDWESGEDAIYDDILETDADPQ